jgi:hypothetical protein
MRLEPGDIVNSDTVDIARITATGVPLVLMPNAQVEEWAATARAARAKGLRPADPNFYEAPSAGMEQVRRELHFAEEGGGWDDYMASQLAAAPGASSPAYVAIPGVTNTSIGVYAFTSGGSTPDTLDGTFEMLHGWVEGSTVYPHIHWAGSTNGAGNIRWVFSYVLMSFDQEMADSVSLPVVVANPGLGANNRPIVRALEFGGIDMTGRHIGTQVRWSIQRTQTDPADDYAANALLIDVGIHVQNDTRGSRQKFVK